MIAVQPLKQLKRIREVFDHATLAVLASLLLTACPGPAPPLQEDLISATTKTADTAGTFEFSIDAWIESRTPTGEISFATTRGQGAARSGESYRMLVTVEPAPPGAINPLVLDEFPGAVRNPGSPYWFSGQSGWMMPFGQLATALPPLGSPATLVRRFESLVTSSTRKMPIEHLGTGEVRGHTVDCYRFTVISGRLAFPAPSPSPFKTTSPGLEATSVTATAQASMPSPKVVEDSATSFLGQLAKIVPSSPPGGTGRIDVVANACVDQIDGRLRRIQTDIEASLHGASFSARASADLWGYDPSGNFHEPIDTTLLGPTSQELIRKSAFPIVAPMRIPNALQFVSMEPITGWAPCPGIKISFTGRGREGYLELLQTAADCALQIPDEHSSMTETASGAQIEFGRNKEGLVLTRKLESTFAQIRTKNGIDEHEALLTASSLTPLSVPIPPGLSLPLPAQGPERR